MLLTSFIASVMTITSVSHGNAGMSSGVFHGPYGPRGPYGPHGPHGPHGPGIKTSFTNTHKFTILQHDQYKLRKNNIHRLSTSIENPTLHYTKNTKIPTYILKYPLPISDVETYVNENYCSPFILYTIINQCCNNLALYHGLLNCYHSNTTISNFDIYDNHICRLSDINTDDKILTLRTKIEDYDMLFDSYLDMISQKNKHFTTMALMFRKSFMDKMTPNIPDTPDTPDTPDEKVPYPEEPKPPSPLLLTSMSATSCISG